MAKVKLGEKIPDFTVASTAIQNSVSVKMLEKILLSTSTQKITPPVAPRKVKTSETNLKHSVPTMP